MAEDNRRLGLLALSEAVGRCASAEKSQNPLAFFGAAAEAVWWATMLDETLWGRTIDSTLYEILRGTEFAGRLLIGLRYARNRQVHDVGITGMQGNPLLKGVGHGEESALWRDLADPNIPQGHKPGDGHWGVVQECAYTTYLAGKPITQSITDVHGFLETCVNYLDQSDSPSRS